MHLKLVLKSGGEYGPEHVDRLVGQLRKHWPTLDSIECLTDVRVRSVPTIALRYGYPGWWSKMELLRPDIAGDFFFMDLDTTIIGDLAFLDLLAEPALLRDAMRNRPEHDWIRAGTGLMFLTDYVRRDLWNQWLAEGPTETMARHRGGDQKFFEWHLRERAWMLQDLYPGKFVSFKVHVRDQGQVPEGAAIVYYHGQPRPWSPEGALP